MAARRASQQERASITSEVGGVGRGVGRPVVGRYILTPAIFAKLERTQRGAGGEIQLTDGIAALLADEPVHVLPFAGIRYDCGSKLGYLRATVEYGLRHPDLGPGFRAYLENVRER